jgi:hypothetical protein
MCPPGLAAKVLPMHFHAMTRLIAETRKPRTVRLPRAARKRS